MSGEMQGRVRILRCPVCGGEIGEVMWTGREWRMVVGVMRLYHADGECEVCGFRWHWTAGKRGIMRARREPRVAKDITAKGRSLPPDCAQS